MAPSNKQSILSTTKDSKAMPSYTVSLRPVHSIRSPSRFRATLQGLFRWVFFFFLRLKCLARTLKSEWHKMRSVVEYLLSKIGCIPRKGEKESEREGKCEGKKEAGRDRGTGVSKALLSLLTSTWSCTPPPSLRKHQLKGCWAWPSRTVLTSSALLTCGSQDKRKRNFVQTETTTDHKALWLKCHWGHSYPSAKICLNISTNK